MYFNFKDLPVGIQKKIQSVIIKDVERWVHNSIPALHEKSVVEMMNCPGGEIEVRVYLQRIESDSH